MGTTLMTEATTYTPRQVRVKLVEHGLSIKQFAERVGITPVYMSYVLSGSRKASVFVWKAIERTVREIETEDEVREL